MLRSDLCDHSDAYIIVKGNITVIEKTFTDNRFEVPNNTEVMLLIMQKIMSLVKKVGF